MLRAGQGVLGYRRGVAVHEVRLPAIVDAVQQRVVATPLQRVPAHVWHAHALAGAQFHPERSAATGARLLDNFLQGAC